MHLNLTRFAVLLGVTVILAGTISSANAALLAYDDLGTPPANPMTWEGPGSAKKVKTGSGWVDGWDAQAQNNSTYYIANSKPLSFTKDGVSLAAGPSYLVGGGAYTSIGRVFHNGNYFGDAGIWGTARRVIRNAQGAEDHVSCGADGSTVWFAALARNDLANNQEWRVSLHDDHIPWPEGKPFITVGVGAGNKWFLSNNGTIVNSDVTCAQGQTYFITIKMEFAAGGDTVTLYINPSPGKASPDVTGFSAKAADVYFQSFRFYPGNDKDCGAIAAIRVGQSFADVAPASAAALSAPSAVTPSTPAAATDSGANRLVLETTSGAQATQTADADATRVDIQKTPADLRCVQVYLTRPELLAGKYKLTFMAKADRARTIGILAAQERSPSNRPLTGTANAQVGTEWKRYILQFQIARPTSDARAPVIQIGDTTGTIWIKGCTIEADTSR